MSDSGPVNFPPSAGLIPERSAPAAGEPAGVAQIISLPEDVREEVGRTRRPLKLGGEVVRENRDGSVRVRTDRGDIDIRPPENQRPPEKGQRVEIEIRPSRNPELPPETAALRPAPPQTSPPPAPDRSASTPVEIEIAPNPAQPQAPRPQISYPPPEIRPAPSGDPPALPPKGIVVRLLPLITMTQEQILPSATAAAPMQPPIVAAPPQTNAPAGGMMMPPESTAALPLAAPLAAHPGAPPLTMPSPAAPLQTPAEPFPPIAGQPPAPGSPPPFPQGGIFAPPEHTGLMAMPPQNGLPGTQPAFASILPPLAAAGMNALDVKIEAAFPPAAGLPVPASSGEAPPGPDALPPQRLQNPADGGLIATVTGKTAENLPILTLSNPGITPDPFHGLAYIMQFPGENIATGTQFHLTPQALPAPTAGAQPSPAAADALPFPMLVSPGPWPLMDEILQNIMQISPQATQTLVNIVPSPANPAQMSPAMLFFIAAVRGGDLSQWLGERVTETLRREGRAPLLSRLAQEGAALNRVAAEPLAQEWRAVNLPMFHQGEMHKIALYYRHERAPEDGGSDGDGPKGTRFVFDLSLSAIGRVQIDGLFRPVSSAGKRLDLALRTEQTFSPQAQADMRRLYAQALRNTQITGELSFQSRPEQWFVIDANRQTSLGVSA